MVPVALVRHYHVRHVLDEGERDLGVISIPECISGPVEREIDFLRKTVKAACFGFEIDPDFLQTTHLRLEDTLEPDLPVTCDSLLQKEGYSAVGTTIRWGPLRIRAVRNEIGRMKGLVPGRMVRYVDRYTNNGVFVVWPAMVVRVKGAHLVNLVVFMDTGLDTKPAIDVPYVPHNVSSRAMHSWHWPPRDE